MFLTFFKPKWQHSNPDVRVQAIEKLRPEQSDHQSILYKLMTEDPSVNVRSAASKRTYDLSALIRLLGQIQSQKDKHTQSIEQRIVELLNEDPDQQHTLSVMFETLGTTASLKLFAQTQHTQLIESQLGQLDEAILVELALSPLPLSIRKEAASKIRSTQALDQLFKESRHRDKAIFKLAKDTLQTQKDAIKQQEELNERAVDLIDQMDQLAHGEWFPLYDARFEVIEKAWGVLDQSSLNDDLTHAFKRAQLMVQDRITTKAQAQAKIEQQKAVQAQSAKEAQSLITEITEQLVPLQEEWLSVFASTELATARLSNAQQVLNVLIYQLDQWPEALEDSALNKKGKALKETLTKKQTLWANAAELHKQAVALLSQLDATDASPSDDVIKEAKTIVTRLNEPVSEVTPLSELLEQHLETHRAQKKAQQHSKQKSYQHLTQLLDELENAIEQGEARNADRCMRKIERADTEHPQIPNTLQNRFKNLSAKLQELKDWQGFAVQPKKEQLCEEMEMLVGADLPPQDKSNAIKALQAQWKSLDATDPVHSSKLWNRFKSASDAAYAPCEQHFEQQRQARTYNLEQRQLIVSELTQYLDQIDWDTTYWRDVETVLNTAKKEWKQYVPVDRGPGQKIQSAFNDLIVSTERHFKSIKEVSLNKKQALIDEAQSLTQSDDPVSAANSAKELQAQWKEAGPTFHSQERKLWIAFRAACDTIFERFSEQQQKERLRSRLSLSSISDRLYHGLNHPTPLDEILHAMHEGQEMMDTHGDAIKERERSQFTKLHAQANQLITTLEAVLKADQANSAAIEPIRIAEDHWLDGNEVNPSELDTLTAGLASDQLPIIQERLLAWRDQADQEIPPQDQLKHAQRHLREIAIELEIMLGLSSPEEDQALRMEMQMLRLQQVLEQATPKHTNASLAEQYQLRLAVPLGQHHPELLKRITQLVIPYLPKLG
jgi:exonuclease SbcC